MPDDRIAAADPRPAAPGLRFARSFPCATLLLAAAACAAPTAEPERPPNLLLIVADDLGYADLGSFGSDIRTPNLDRLAAEGVRFTRFHAGPSCAPSRAMLLTGNNNHVAGMGQQATRVEGVPGYENRLSERVVPLPRLLAEAGYHTSTAGKWHLGTGPDEGPPSAGFQRSWSLIEGAGSHYEDTGFFEGGSTYRADGVEVGWPEGAYATEHYTDRILESMDEARRQDRPFFVYAAYTSPHWPLQVPDAELERYAGAYDEGYDVWRERNFERLREAGVLSPTHELPPRNEAIPRWDSLEPEMRAYYARAMELYAAMVENLDGHIGRLVASLEEQGELERTLIVFLSDNGAAYRDWWHGGEGYEYVRAHYDNAPERRGRAGSWVSYGPGWAEAGSAPFSRYKSFAREGGLVAPMIVRGAGVSGTGRSSDAYLTIMDVAPTLLEAAGARYPAEGVRPMLGESFGPLLAGTRDVVHAPEYVTTLFHDGRAFVRRGSWKLVSLEPPFDEAAMELFDLDVDPGETRDLRALEPEVHAGMLALWRSERRRLGIVLPSEFDGRQ